MFQLRYYAPDYNKEVYDNILSLLTQIKMKRGISYEITELRYRKSEYSKDYIAEEQHEREVYERDFRPRKSVLKQRIGESIRRLLRSRKGGYFVAGTVAITLNGQVEWFASYANLFKEYDKEPSIGFLKAVLDKGSILLTQLCPEVRKGKGELRILDIFIGSSVLKGKFEREVKTGKRIFKTERGTFDWRKSIDLTCKGDTEVWVLEGKNRLNYEALGEVLTYSTLYAEEFPEKRLKMGIVCGTTEEEILKTCRKHGVTVFEVIGKEVIVHSVE